MSCIPNMGSVPSGAGPSFVYNSPKRTARKVARLAKLAASDCIAEQCAAAGNPMLGVHVLDRLSGDENIVLRSWALRNPVIPLWILEKRLLVEEDKSLLAFIRYRICMLD